MALDVTSNEVHALINSTETGIDLTPQINAANLMVTEDLATSGLSDDRKRLISLYLAAHFSILTLERGGLTHYEVGESVEKYPGVAGSAQGLNATKWGQQAVALDTSGTLALNAQPTQKAEFRVVGDKLTRFPVSSQ